MPAPIDTSGRLCGMNFARSRASRGPITHAATKPLVPGGEVDDVATGVVEGTLVRPVAATPDQHRVDRVDEGRPQRDEDHPDADLDPAEHAAQEQQRGDRGEDELEVEQRRRRLGQRQRGTAVREELRLGGLGRSRVTRSRDGRRSCRRSS